MFDIGGWEFLLIAILGIIIIGPKELPGAIRTVSQFVRRARSLARDFQDGLEEVAREAEFDKVSSELKGLTDSGSAIGDFRDEIENSVDPDNEIRHAMEFDREWTDDELADFPENTEDVQEKIRQTTAARKKDEADATATAEAEAADDNVPADTANADTAAADTSTGVAEAPAEDTVPTDEKKRDTSA